MIVVQVLGGAIITSGEHRIRASAARIFAMALYLAGERGRYLNRAVALTTLFGDQADANAAHSFRQFVYRLRTAGFPIESRETDLRLPADAVRTDVDDVLEAKRLSVEQLTAIQRGVLPGVSYPSLPLLNEWLDSYRTRIERELQQALVKQLGAAREVGDWANAERAARACLTFDPLNEEATLGLAESLAVGGSKAAAVKLLEEYSNEVGVSSGDLKIAANVLRRRISERLPETGYRAKAELPFVGRRSEMLLLRERLALARRAEGQCVLIYGEPGIGKTKLTTEFANLAVLDGARVTFVAAQPHDVHQPLAAFAQLVPSLLRLPGAIGCSPESMSAVQRLVGGDNASVTDADNGLDAAERYHRITTAIRDLIDAVAAESLLVIAVEDAHWLDELSLQLMGTLVADRTERRLFLIVTSRERDTILQRARQADRVTLLHLAPLDADATSELATLALATTGVAKTDDLLRRIQRASAGNPLFVVSLADHWRHADARYSTPASLNSLITYQLDKLSSSALTVLHTVILLGRNCTPGRLAECLELRALELADALQELEDRSLVRSASAVIETRHALIADVTLERAPQSKLGTLRVRIAAVLETQATDDGAVMLLWDAAEHWHAAGYGDRAFAVFNRCADAAIHIGRPVEAADILTRAARLTSSQELRVNAVTRAAALAADASEATKTIELVQLVRTWGGAVPHGLAVHELVALFHLDRESATIPERLEAIVSERPPRDVTASAALLMIKAADRLRDPRIAERAVTLRDASMPLRTEQALDFDLVYHTAFGDLEDAASIARQIMLHSERLPTGPYRIGWRHNAGQVLAYAGYVDEGVQILEECYAAGIHAGLIRQPLAAALQLASIERARARADKPSEWTPIVRRLAEQSGATHSSHMLVFDGVQAALTQDTARLTVIGDEILRWSATSGVRTTKIWGHVFIAAAAHSSGCPAGAATIEGLSIPPDRLRGFGADDLIVEVLAEDLRLRNEDDQASSLVHDYLTRYRKARGPLWVGLRRLIEKHGLASTDDVSHATSAAGPAGAAHLSDDSERFSGSRHG